MVIENKEHFRWNFSIFLILVVEIKNRDIDDCPGPC